MGYYIPVDTLADAQRKHVVRREYDAEEYPRYKYCQCSYCPNRMEIKLHADMIYLFELYFCSYECSNQFYRANKETLDAHAELNSRYKFLYR